MTTPQLVYVIVPTQAGVVPSVVADEVSGFPHVGKVVEDLKIGEGGIVHGAVELLLRLPSMREMHHGEVRTIFASGMSDTNVPWVVDIKNVLNIGHKTGQK